MIRFKNKSIRILKTDKGYAVSINLLKTMNGKRQPHIVCGLNTKKCRDEWRRFLEENCGKNNGPCGGKIYYQNGRWMITLCREKYESEIAKPEINEDFTAYIYSGDDCFLHVEMTGRGDRSWGFNVSEEAYLKSINSNYYNLKRSVGENFRCSASRTASRGHGLKRKNKSLVPESKKKKIDRWFIETRTHEILRRITEEGKCGTIIMEDLVGDNSERISFPYFIFMKRMEEKARERGCIFKKYSPNDMKEIFNKANILLTKE
jgi:hypothetical protein